MSTAWLRLIFFTCMALVLAALLARTSGYMHLSYIVQDNQQRLSSSPYHAKDALIVNIDEESLRKLQPYLGSWPYHRDVFALITRYLHDAGAKAIVYDVLFTDAREGDDQFAAAIAESGNVVLASGALPYSLASTSRPAQASAFPCNTAELPITSWPELMSPVSELTATGHVMTGIITVSPDADGTLRKLSLLHNAHNTCLPALALAALFPDALPAPRYTGKNLNIGEYDWPVTEAGQAILYFPQNADIFLMLPFHKLALTVLGAPGQALNPDEFKGKTVFIGSTAPFFADTVHTPQGQMPGVSTLALMHQNLAHQLLLSIAPGWLNTLLLALALTPVLLLARYRPHSIALLHMAPIAGALLALGGHYLLLRYGQIQADLLLPLTTLLLLWLIQFSDRLWRLSQERQKLLTQKRVAEQSNLLKSQFLATMTHELRTPLTAIIGFNRLLKENEKLSSSGRKYIDTINTNGEYLLSLINNLLDQAKIESGQMTIQARPTNVNGLVNGIAETLTAMARAKGITLSVDCPRSFPASLLVDAMRLRQILLNLAGNAVKFTEHGRVQLVTRWQNGTLTITVQDTGPGIPAKEQERIFDAFYQPVHEKGGSGLGLMISRTLAHLMGGDITLESTPGMGSSFIFSLPAPVIEPAVQTSQATSGARPAIARRVLLVEDTEDVRALIEIYLSGMGYQVLLAENGQRGVAVALDQRPDIVLMDLEMPVMDGKQAVQQLRRAGFIQPVLALTSHSVDAIRSELLALGFSDCLTKTADRTTLKAAIDHLLNRGETRG